MKKTILLVFTAAAIILTSNGCKKDDDSNLQPSGNYVTTGSNNNTVQSFTFDITSAMWSADSANLQWGAPYQLPTSLDMGGAVLLYAQDGSNWAALPHVDYGITYEFGYDPSAKIIEVQAADSRASVMIGNPGDMTFKVVCIPTRMCHNHPNVNFKNYYEVVKTFNLPLTH